MTTEEKANIDICSQCYGVIDGAVEKVNLGFMTHEVRRTLCDRCTFLAGWRQAFLLSRPYKTPNRRPTRDGEPPASWYKWCRKHREKSGPTPGPGLVGEGL